jgi:HNH endonuclease
VVKRCKKIPSHIERQLRQEANFGCAMCGCPVLENAHIIPFRESQEFLPEDMVALCPKCHTKADLGHYPEYVFRDVKNNPYNKTTTGEKFMVTGNDLVVKLGSYTAVNTERVLVVDDFDIVSIRRNHGNYLFLDVNFFDKFGRFVGIITDNNWIVDTSYFWDVEYKPQHLIIRSKPRQIDFEIKIENEQVFIRGEIFYNRTPITMTESGIKIGDFNLGSFTVANTKVGLDARTRRL